MKYRIYHTVILSTLLLASCRLPFFNESSSPSSSSITSSEINSSPEFSSTDISVSSSEVSSSIIPSSSLPPSSASSETPSSSEPLPSYSYSGYYQTLHGLSDQALLPAVRLKVRSILDRSNLLPSNVTYGNARDVLQLSDKDPNNPNNIILVYRQTSIPKTWDSGSSWNREHVFPQSLLGVDTNNNSRHSGADYHNLKPANPSENSSRGNKYFANTPSSAAYTPPNVVKGDIARILLYMVTMYPQLTLIDVTTESPRTYQMAQFSTLMQWHKDDPVDAFELNRNNIIYQYQGNRNPYIDHPELTCRIFKTQLPPTSTACQA